MHPIIRPIYRDIKSTLHAYREHTHQLAINEGRNIRFYNWWQEEYENLWWFRFVRNTNIIPDDKILNFCSVFGPRKVANFIDDGPVVFFSGENIPDTEHLEYGDHLLANKNTILSMGFDSFVAPKYLRFPLWIPFLFPPTIDEKVIHKRCEQLRYPEIGERNKFASLICRYDWRGTRTEIFNAIKHIGQVSCPSAIKHNDDDLKLKYNDNKIEYLKQFKFNICPENADSYGYVTEKAFEAIAAGCIPIYWGSNNDPEPAILNKDAMILWNMGGDNSQNIQFIQELSNNNQLYMDFFSQPRIKPDVEEVVCYYLVHVKEIIEQAFIS